ncbi:MAG: hypothetical protein ACUVQM_04760 [Candidatus Hadarchaeaceae archaeon]
MMSLRRYRWQKPDWCEKKKRRQKKWKRKHEPTASSTVAPTSTDGKRMAEGATG